ncbi:hypothetical protein BVRB_3g060120 [Beta vulgaris subsp. vulgaris]|nr:hypothetical protein BVRB_3g060120 [Beta vulgaris subsp. vulgaris]
MGGGGVIAAELCGDEMNSQSRLLVIAMRWRDIEQRGKQ